MNIQFLQPIPTYTSFLRTSNGGLLTMPRLLNKPIKTVSDVIVKNTSSMSNKSGLKAVSKLNLAKAQLPIKAIIKPVKADIAPRKKYSSEVMVNICLRLAPKTFLTPTPVPVMNQY